MSATTSGPAMKALTLRLGDEIFALEATCVREILDMIPVTRVPGAPPALGGVINVRGAVAPLADLRVMFGMASRPADADTRIVVIETELDGEAVTVALIADKVETVADLSAADIGEAPRIGMRWPPEFVRGVGRRDDDFIIIPNLERLLAAACGPAKSPATS